MPTALRNTTRALICEVADHLGEVLHYSHDERDWRRMTGYRLTDAVDTAGMLADVFAAHHIADGMQREKLHRYLQVSQQECRAELPTNWGRAVLADMQGRPRPEGAKDQIVSCVGVSDDPWLRKSEACLTALFAVHRGGDPAYFEELDAETRGIAERVLQALQDTPSGTELEPIESAA